MKAGISVLLILLGYFTILTVIRSKPSMEFIYKIECPMEPPLWVKESGITPEGSLFYKEQGVTIEISSLCVIKKVSKKDINTHYEIISCDPQCQSYRKQEPNDSL